MYGWHPFPAEGSRPRLSRLSCHWTPLARASLQGKGGKTQGVEQWCDLSCTGFGVRHLVSNTAGHPGFTLYIGYSAYSAAWGCGRVVDDDDHRARRGRLKRRGVAPVVEEAAPVAEEAPAADSNEEAEAVIAAEVEAATETPTPEAEAVAEAVSEETPPVEG